MRTPSIALIGDTFGPYTVIGEAPKANNPNRRVYVRHTDGTETDMDVQVLQRGTYVNPKGRKPVTVDEGLHAHLRNVAKQRNIPFMMSVEDVASVVHNPCHYCGLAPSNRHPHKGLYSGLDRVDNTGGYYLKNVVPCCSACNYAKRFMTVEDFLDWVERIHAFQHQKEK